MEVTLTELDSLDTPVLGSLWTIPNNESLGVLIEQTAVDSPLPVDSSVTSTQLISGELPGGLVLVDSRLRGTLEDVAFYTTSSFVIRARAGGRMEDRTIQITVSGPDSPEWQTPAGLLPVGSDPTTLYVLDQDLVNYQLEATDADAVTGQELTFYLSAGELPPGLHITSSGAIQGITDLLKPNIASLESLPYVPNRTYPFTVTVTDGVESVDRDFMIYVVSYDYLLSEIDIDPVTGVGLESVPPIRQPMWLTPSNLGTVRADNYATFPLEIVDYTDGVVDYVQYSLEPVNDDLSLSVLPENTQLDQATGVVHGYIPPQDPITIPHKFTVKAQVITPNTVEINGDLVATNVAMRGDACFYIEDLDPDIQQENIGSLAEDIKKETLGARVQIRDRGYVIAGFPENRVCMEPELDTPPDFVTSRNTTQDSKSFYVGRVGPETRDFYRNSEFRYDSNEYGIGEVYPVIEYRVRKIGYSPNDSDYAAIPDEFHAVDNVMGYLEDGYSELGDRGYPYAVENVTWTTKSSSQMTVIDKIEQMRQNISQACDSPLFFRRINENNLGIVLIANECSRDQSAIQQAIQQVNPDLQLETVIHDDTLDYAFLEDRLLDHVRAQTDLTVVVRKGDVIRNRYLKTGRLFSEEISATRTFDVDTIGEIDSFIQWITPKNLGSIQRQLVSRLRVSAQTSYPNSTIVYELTGGSLPAGMHLTSSGSIVGEPEYSAVGSYSFRVLARETQFPVETVRTFNLEVFAEREFEICDVFIKALPSVEDRDRYDEFVNLELLKDFELYRPLDSAYGLQTSLDILIYSGIQRQRLRDFYTATTTHHRRKRYVLGEFQSATARETPDSEPVYDVVYIPAIDSSDQGESQNLGQYTKSSISNMRREISNIGDDERRALPLWMRSTQNGFQELDYVAAIPVAYLKPGHGEAAAQRLNLLDFKPNQIDYESDRYVIKNPSDYSQEKYVVFNNSPLNL